MHETIGITVIPLWVNQVIEKVTDSKVAYFDQRILETYLSSKDRLLYYTATFQCIHPNPENKTIDPEPEEQRYDLIYDRFGLRLGENQGKEHRFVTYPPPIANEINFDHRDSIFELLSLFDLLIGSSTSHLPIHQDKGPEDICFVPRFLTTTHLGIRSKEGRENVGIKIPNDSTDNPSASQPHAEQTVSSQVQHVIGLFAMVRPRENRAKNDERLWHEWFERLQSLGVTIEEMARMGMITPYARTHAALHG